MLRNIKRKNLIKIISSSIITAGVGTSIGVGYYYTQESNTYAGFFKRPTTYGDDALNQVYISALHSGADILIGAGFTHENVIKKLSANKKFEQTAFLGIDINYNGQHGENVSIANFKTEQSGFLTALATAEYLNQNQSFFINDKSPYLSFGMWGGMPVPSVDSYLSGFQQGISFYNTKILPLLNRKNVLTNEQKSYQKIYMTCAPKFYADGFDPNNGDSIIESFVFGETKTFNLETQELIGDGIVLNAIFAVAGPQTENLVTKIYNTNSKIAVIGVDTPMENDFNINKEYKTSIYPKLNNKENKFIIPFSAIKNIQQAVEKILDNIYNGVTKPNNIEDFGGLGWSSIGTISNNGVGISEIGKENIINLLFNSKIIKNNNFNDVKEYFINQYNINDKKILKPIITIWSNGFNKKEYLPYSQSNWLLSKEQNYDDFIKKNNQVSSLIKNKLNKDTNNNLLQKIKMILPTPNSVLFDNSFSENVYYGMSNFLKQHGINIPNPNKR